MTVTQTAARKAAELRDEAARQRSASEEAPGAAQASTGAQAPPWNGKTIDQDGNPVQLPPDPPQRLAYGPQFRDALETAKRLARMGTQ
jgi:hypothetical protein